MSERPSPGHESQTIAVSRVLSIGGILAVGIIVVVLVVRLLLRDWIATPPDAWRSAAIPPTPRLQPHPGSDLVTLRVQKDALLSTWSWTSPTHEFARISIERAMAIYSQMPTAASRVSSKPPEPQEPRR